MALPAGLPFSFAVGFMLPATSAYTEVRGISQLAHHHAHVNCTRHQNHTLWTHQLTNPKILIPFIDSILRLSIAT